MDRSTPSNLIPILIAIAGLALGYFYYASLPPVTITDLPQDIKTSGLNNFKDVRLDVKTLDKPQFQSLKIYGESPVIPGITGKTDIFSQT